MKLCVSLILKRSKPTMRQLCSKHVPVQVRTVLSQKANPNLQFSCTVDLQSLFGLHVHSCTHWLRPRNPPPAPHLGLYTRALLVSQDRRHLFVTPCLLYSG